MVHLRLPTTRHADVDSQATNDPPLARKSLAVTEALDVENRR